MRINNNIRFFFFFFFVATAAMALAQKPYFQQEVNYTIKVNLDDTKHTLTGDISFEYINHSPDQLSEIWVHLWPNAFKNRRSAFCKQKLRQGKADFYFAKDTDLGSIKSLDFMVDGAKAAWKYDPQNPDIARIPLASPLKSGGKIVVTTPFVVKIPASFSRLGHVGTSYQITQWYPKPAVYDRDGWHAMPYLDQGEFYSEFGSFDVKITLPENYVVGATGMLQNAAEWAFLSKKEAETRAVMATLEETTKTTKRKRVDTNDLDSFPPSANTFKTLHYKADNVHDFAWFADKRFYVLKDTARLASGKTVDCWGMFTKSDFKHWKKGAFYVKRSVEFYSKNVGEYPWPHATAVHSALSAGGGMEYPMITVIGNSDSDKSLDLVITHEVGHNWFYGLLASNERDHSWMDEGMNSYYEDRYMRTYYGSGSMDDQIPKKIFDPLKYGSLVENVLLVLARNGENTSADINADKMSNIAYGVQAYMKTSFCMRWLENAVGVEKYDAAMQAYFKEWRFKHPQPEDFSASMTKSGIDINWFMAQMQTRKKSDPALKNATIDANGNTVLKVKEKGQITAPFSVSAMKNGQPTATKWFSPEAGQTLFNMGKTDADAFLLNNEGIALDNNAANNNLKTNGLFKKGERLNIGLIKPFERRGKKNLGVLPWVGWNNYDKGMAGLLLYNPPLPGQKIQYYLAPGIALNNGEFVGGGDIRYRLHPVNGAIKRVTVGVNGRTFNENLLGRDEKYLSRFYRITPWVQADFRSSNTALRQSVAVRWNYIGLENGFDTAGVKKPDYISNIWETKYQLSNLGKPNPYDLTLALEGQNWDDDGIAKKYLRLGLEWKQSFFYTDKRKVNFRFYGGYFIQNSSRERKSLGFGADDPFARGSLSLAQNGYTDYKHDYLYLNRNGSSGFANRQIQQAEGGFKYAFGSQYQASGDVGHSNNYLFAVNLEADLPKKLPLGIPLKPYFDLGYADLGYLPSGGTEPSSLFWSGGFALSFLNGYFNVYFPAINSQNINRLYKETSKGNYLRRITWSIKMNGLEPLGMADRLLK
jgi:hypothetical protein